MDNNISINIYQNIEDALLDLKSQNFIADYIFVDYNISILIGFGLISFVGQKTQFVLVGNSNNTNIKQAHSINNLSKTFNLHYVNKNYDEGATIFQESFLLSQNETAGSLAKKIHTLEYEYFPKVIRELLTSKTKKK